MVIISPFLSNSNLDFFNSIFFLFTLWASTYLHCFNRIAGAQLLEHYDEIINALCDGSNVDVIYQDFAINFDKVLGIVKNTRDVENVQADLEEIFKWADENNMKFNKSKFELLGYGKNTDLKKECTYFSSNYVANDEKETLQDLGVQMQNKASFDEQIAKVPHCGDSSALCLTGIRLR